MEYFIMWKREEKQYFGPFPTREQAQKALEQGQKVFHGPDGSTRTSQEFPDEAIVIWE